MFRVQRICSHLKTAPVQSRSEHVSTVNEPILVTGAAGAVGSVGFKIVEQLRAQGVPVRALVRRFDKRSEALAKLGAEVVKGDLTDLQDVHKAVQGCRRIYFGMSVAPNYLEATVNVAAIAKHYGVEVLVNMSQMSVSEMNIFETSPSPQHKLHWLGEQALNWSGVPTVHVRPTVFLEHLFFLKWAAESIKASGEIRLPFGSGKTSPIATQDIARVVATILLSPKEHIGKVYELTGARSQDMYAMAAEYSAALGRQIKYVDVTWEEWKKGVQSSGLPEHVQNHFLTMAKFHKENRYDRFSNGVEEVT